MDEIDEIMTAGFSDEEAPQQKGSGPDGEDAPAGRPADEAQSHPPEDRQPDEGGPHLPDGIGLDYEGVRQMLAMKHETAIKTDDPLMMMVTICNVFLGELEKLNHRHNEAVSKLMVCRSGEYIAEVKASTESLGKTLAKSSTQAIRDIFNLYAADDKGGAVPLLPEGIGMDYEDVRKLLSMKHETMLGKDEPIMMMVTLCNVFLGQLEKLHQRHNEAVTKIMSDQSKKYIDSVKVTTDALGQTLTENSVEAIRNIFHSHTDALKSHAAELNANRLNSRWCAAIIAVSALANAAVLAFGFWR